jgi:hypothetical protein
LSGRAEHFQTFASQQGGYILTQLSISGQVDMMTFTIEADSTPKHL